MKQHPLNWARLAAALMAVLALGGWPYGYFVLLRWIVTLAAALTALRAFELDRAGWAWSFVALGLLFNPLLPVHLDRDLWKVIDLGAAVALVASLKEIPPAADGGRSKA